MDPFYLNSEKRDYYSNAWELARNCEDESLRPDDVEEYIDRINLNGNVCTMLSKKGVIGSDNNSYLTICYTKDVESKINKEITPRLEKVFMNTYLRTFRIHKQRPQIVAEDKGAHPCLRYINDANYWNVHNIKFELNGGSLSDHETFWTILSNELSAL